MARQHISTLKTNMVKENTGLKIRLKKLDEMRNYLLQDIKHDLMSKKQKKMCRTLNYFEHSLLFISAVTDCFDFRFCFISPYSYRNFKFCCIIKNMCIDCRNQKV